MPKQVNLKGFKEYEKRVKQGATTLRTMADHEASAAAQNIARAARTRAPHFDGKLRSSINTDGANGRYEVSAAVHYAAYIEFGTKSRVKVPADLQQYAKVFKGKGIGDYYDFLNAILDWVKKKGIGYGATFSVKTQRRTGGKKAIESQDLAAAEAIAMSILRHGIHPQPFLFPSVEEEQPKFYQRIRNLLNDL